MNVVDHCTRDLFATKQDKFPNLRVLYQGRKIDLNSIIFLSLAHTHTYKIDIIISATKENKVPKYTHTHTYHF